MEIGRNFEILRSLPAKNDKKIAAFFREKSKKTSLRAKRAVMFFEYESILLQLFKVLFSPVPHSMGENYVSDGAVPGPGSAVSDVDSGRGAILSAMRINSSGPMSALVFKAKAMSLCFQIRNL